MSTTRARIQAFAARELLTVFRARSTYLLFGGVLLVAFGVVLTSGSDPDYLPTAVDLLLPMELLVPAVAVAFGYRTITADAGSGELAVFRTHPLPTWGYVIGVYVGRLLALVVVLGVPLVLIGIYLSTVSPEQPSLFATHRGVDSPIIFIRFVVLTVLFGATVLAMALAASALARSHRSALVGGIVLLFVVVIVLDLLVVRGLAGEQIGPDQLRTVLAFSPASGYRGLVFETVLSPATGGGRQHASPSVSGLALLLWTAGSLLVTSVALRRR